MRVLLVAAAVALGLSFAPVAQAATYPSVVYTSSDSTVPLNITAPGTYDGQHHKVPSIKIVAGGVTVRNFVVTGGVEFGISSQGGGNLIQDNDISQISYGPNGLDGIRFFGNTQILHNTVHSLVKGDPHGFHPNAVRTYVIPGVPFSGGVVIADNQWLGSDFAQCLMAEGAHSTAGGGGGTGFSASWTIRNNRCQGTSNQAIALRDIHVVSVNDNTFDGHDAMAVQVTDGSTMVTFSGNTLGRNVGKLSGS